MQLQNNYKRLLNFSEIAVLIGTALFLCLLPIYVNAQIKHSVEGDRQALMDLYEATGGDSWKNNSGWGSGDPSDSWYGVEVNADGRVIRLDLSGNNLTGSLPESIGNLTKLRYFNVKQNYIVSEIPSSIGNMESLRHLLLNGRIEDMTADSDYHPGKEGSGAGASERTNRFTGEIPSTIGKLTNLEFIEITGRGQEDIKNGSGYPNSLTGPIPREIGNLTNLKGIHLGFNSLSSLPNSMGNLTELVHLGLLRNKLAGEGFPSWIGKLTKLRNIWLNKNNIGGTIPDLRNLHDLRIFLVPFNNLEGEIPDYLFDGTMPHINMVNLAWNELTGTLPEFGTPNNLKAFQVAGNNLTGTIPESITNIPHMINLSLGWNDFEGKIPDLSHMYQLRFVRANSNNFTGPVPMVDTSNEKLSFLHFQNNDMSGRIPVELAKLKSLPKFEILNIRNNNFTKDDLQPLIEALKEPRVDTHRRKSRENNTTQNTGGLDILVYDNQVMYESVRH